MKPARLFDAVIDRAVLPVAAIFVVLPCIVAWHFVAERENARRGRR